jgi:hypothetical protein
MQGDGNAASGGTATVASANAESAAPVIAKPVANVIPAVVKAPKAIVAKPVVSAAVSKPPVPKPAVVNAAVSKPSTPKPLVAHAAASNPPIQKPDLSSVAAPGPAAPKPVVLNAAVPKPAAPKPGTAPKLVASKMNHPAAKKVVATYAVGKPKPGSGMSAANAKVFARLAAEHRAQLAKEHKAAAGNVARNGKTGVKSGVTP